MRFIRCCLGFTLTLLALLGACTRVTPEPSKAHGSLAIAAAPTHVFEQQWGSGGRQPGQFQYPSGIAVDRAGFVYVADTNNHRIQKFSLAGELIAAWGTEGSEAGQFLYPRAVSLSSDGFVYVADTANNRVQKFDPDGSFLMTWGEAGSGDGQFASPYGITVDGEGYVYLADTGNQRIQKFDSDGVFVKKWGFKGIAQGFFDMPMGIVADNMGHVYVTEFGNHRVQRFSTSGTFEVMWGTEGTATGEFRRPHGVAVDGSGRVFVADRGNLRVQMFNPDGVFLGGWLTENSAHSSPNYPLGIAVAESGTVYVTDLYNHLVQAFVPATGSVPTVLVRTSGSGVYAQPGVLRASVLVDGDPRAGITVNFTLKGSPVGSAVTGDDGIAVLSGVSLEGIGAGIHYQAVQADFTDGSLYGSSQGLLRVDKAEQTLLLTGSVPARASIHSSITVGVSASSGLPAMLLSDTPEICSVTGENVTFVALGTCTLRAVQAGNANYHAASELERLVTVHANLPTTLTQVSAAGVYGGALTLTATLESEGNALAGKAISFTVQGRSIGSALTDSEGRALLTGVNMGSLGAGHYADVVTASFGAGEGLEASQGSGELVIDKAEQTLTFISVPPLNATAGGSYTVSASASSGLVVGVVSITPSVCTVSGTRVNFVASGTCELRASQPGNANYEAAADITQSFAVGAQIVGYTLNFSTSPFGRVISDARLGRGITSSSGRNTSSVAISAERRDKSGNVAMVIGTPRHLVISKDGVTKASYAKGGSVTLEFDAFAEEGVLLNTLKVRSTTTTGGSVAVYRGGELLRRVSIPRTGSGVTRLLSLNVPEANRMVLTLTGPGAIDDVVFKGPQ